MVMRWASPYEGADRCTGSTTPGARALMAWFLETYAQGENDGIYNCRTVRGGATTSLHGEGRADDLGFPVVGGKAHPDGYDVLRRLGAVGDRLGVQLVIWDRRKYGASYPDGAPYGGVHPHLDHLHVELTWHAARNLNLATCRALLNPATPPPPPPPPAPNPEDDEMVNEVIGLHTAYLGAIPGTPSWTKDVQKSVDYWLWMLLTNQASMEQARQAFSKTAGLS